MLYMLDIARVPCETSAVLRLYMVIGAIINILKMATPIVLVVVATIEFVKLVLESEEKDSNSIKRIISKFIAAILVFFVPTLVSFLLKSFVPSMAICYNNANIKTIEYFEELEKKFILIMV